MIRFHNGFIGVPTSPMLILLIHFSKQPEMQRIEKREQEKIRSNEDSTDEMTTDIKSPQKKEQPKGTTETHLRES